MRSDQEGKKRVKRMITVEMLGERIRAYRLKRGWNEHELGTRLGLSHASISRLEHGQQNVSVHLLFAVAETLDVTLWQLIGDEGQEAPPWVLSPQVQHLLKAIEPLSDAAMHHLTAFVLTVQDHS
jgi:transcriptional regulator with XRE-family HTH domain